MRRALSWLDRAEKEDADDDAAFIFYWIAFNAAYGSFKPDTLGFSERGVFREYFSRIIDLDTEHVIYGAIWERFSDAIRIFLGNKYVFQPFWDHHHGGANEDWEDKFKASSARVNRALGKRDTAAILSTLFDRLYVLRNQLLHGGATWGGSVNRPQVRDGVRIMAFLVPLFIGLMMDNPQIPWGPPRYPVVN